MVVWLRSWLAIEGEGTRLYRVGAPPGPPSSQNWGGGSVARGGRHAVGFYRAVSVLGSFCCFRIHALRRVPGPPNLVMFAQNRQSPQSGSASELVAEGRFLVSLTAPVANTDTTLSAETLLWWSKRVLLSVESTGPDVWSGLS